MATQRRSYVWQGTSSAMLASQVWPNAVVGPQNLRPAILISYDDTITAIADLDFYMLSMGFVVGTGNIATDPTVTPIDLPKGSLIVDSNGDWYRKLDDGSTTNVDPLPRVATLATTTAALTAIATVAIPDNTVVLVRSEIVGRRTNGVGRASYVRNAVVFREAAGAATLESAVDSPLTREGGTGVAAYNATMDVSGNNLLIEVQGNTGHNVDWKCRYTIVEVG